jgi:hypothetical protein
MEVFFVWILPVILVALECWFIRSCMVGDDERKAPRLVVLLLILGSLAPVVGWVVFVGCLIWICANASDSDSGWRIAENRFTRYWIKD